MGNITRTITAARSNFDKKLYFKEDFYRIVGELEQSVAKKLPDREQTLRSKLIRMLDSFNIKVTKTTASDEFRTIVESADIPSISTFPDYCRSEFEKLGQAYSYPGDYMARLVDRLADADLGGGTVRLRILKQMLSRLEFLRGTRFYDERICEIVDKEYGGRIEDIDDGIFDNYLVDRHVYPVHKCLTVLLDVYGALIYKKDEHDSELESIYGSDDEALTILASIRKQNPDGDKVYTLYEQDPALVEAVYGHLESRLAQYKNEFKKSLTALTRIAAKSGRSAQKAAIVEFIKDNGLEAYIDIPDGLSDARLCEHLLGQLREFKKIRNKQYTKGTDNTKIKVAVPEILRICDNLQSGAFRKNSEMKQILYLFAFAFDMTPDVNDNYRSVIKNLFEDYYCDNITRYTRDYQKVGSYDEPMGITVQYRNFVEMVYLYWLGRDDGTSAYRRLMSAIDMIKDIVKRYRAAQKKAVAPHARVGRRLLEAQRIAEKKSRDTMTLRSFLLEHNILDMEPGEFCEFLLKNYDVDTSLHYTGKQSAEGFENEDNFNSAKEEYHRLFEMLENEYGNVVYKLEFFGRDKLIDKINEQIAELFEKGDDGCVTRTRLMYLFYNQFVGHSANRNYHDTFDDFCDEYISALNDMLDYCSYQLFCEKNLIDVMLLYSAFIILRTENIDY